MRHQCDYITLYQLTMIKSHITLYNTFDFIPQFNSYMYYLFTIQSEAVTTLKYYAGNLYC